MNIKRILPFALLFVVLIGTRTARATYSYYYTENMGSPYWSNWVDSGLGVKHYGSNSGVCGAGSMMYSYAVAGGADVSMTVHIGPANDGVLYAVLSADSTSPPILAGGSGNFTVMAAYAADGSVELSQVTAGSWQTLASTTTGLHDGSIVRTVGGNGSLGVYIDGVLALDVPWTGYSGTTYNGVGCWDTLNDGTMVSSASLGYIDSVGPTAIPSSSISVSTSYTYVDLSWAAASDDSDGPGIYQYVIFRNGQSLGTTQSLSYADTTVVPDTTYTYTIAAMDMHFKFANTNKAATTLSVVTGMPYPSTTPDGRRTGVRSTGAYWGASPETIDVESGNLNFGVPLLNAQQRGGKSVGFNLLYNSQNWRKDSAGVWLFDKDVGYGFGFRLMAGSVEPVFNPGGTTPAYYLFIDSTGAEYNLSQSSGNVWSSKESIYVWFDANTNILHFRDGSFWNLGCITSSSENDGGTMYPTVMEDTNGNQILIRYLSGAGATWTNSSARISQIEDVRAVLSGGVRNTYTFTYNADTPPHLTAIANTISSGEAYTFAYQSSSLTDPYVSGTWGTVKELYQATVSNVSTYHQFTYDSAGELTKIQLPYKGYLAYDYGTTNYSGPGGNKSYREVTNRYLSKDGSTQTTYPFTKDVNPSTDVHSYAQIDDPGGVGEKYWSFATTGSYVGLTTSYQGRDRSAGGPSNCLSGTTTGLGACKTENDFTWTQDSTFNSYISSTVTTADPGQTYAAQMKTAQTLDIYGNVTQLVYYNYGNLATPYLTENFTYVTAAEGSQYPARYIFNRLYTSPTTSVYYDNCGALSGGGAPEWDAAYASVSARGNVSTVYGPSGTLSTCPDTYGDTAWSSMNGMLMQSISTSSATNYSAPEQLSVGSLTTLNTYNSFLGLAYESTPNGASVSLGYDASARPASSRSPFGGTTTTSYADTASPPTTTSTINGRWTKATMDGLGRPIKAESGDASNTYSVAETAYDSCGCSPLGKLKQQAVPHVPGATPAYTTYTYDGIGRTISVQAPDGASTTTYLYQGNTVKVTDPAGNWKKFTMDALGNLTQVNEPNPGGGSDYVTTYTYNLLYGELAGVSMTRGTVTQTRTFTYGTNPYTSGRILWGTANPENGTVNYTYNTYNKLATVVDAKNQKTAYTYDSYGRVTEVQKYPVSSGSEDTCQQVTYSYDSNPFDSGTYSTNVAGRLAAVQYMGGNTGSGCNTTFQEWYKYGAPGAPTGKRMHISRSGVSGPLDLAATFGYDNEGRMTSEGYPTDTGGTTASLSMAYDSMGRLNTVTDTLASLNIIASASYGPANELLSLTAGSYSGNWGTETRTYNAMKQLTSLTSNGVNMTYNFSATQNNGKVTSQYDAISGETIVYAYDSLKRLASAGASGTWNQGYAYDGFGNMTGITGTGTASGTTASFTVDTLTNHAPCSDANGNANEVSCAGSYYGYTYDISNRIVITPSGSPGGTMCYSYAPSSARVWRGNGGSTDEVTVWSPGGQRLGTYSLAVSGGNLTATQTGTRYYFGGKLIKNKNGWVNADRLGSAGKYYPYGTDKGSGNPANGTEKFTGYQRDAETGLDYAVNRYEQPGTGRFLTADRITGNPSNPGSLNRYAYVGSDPVNKTDPEGTCSPEDDPPCFDTTGTAYANTCLDSYDWCDAFFVIGMPGVYGNPKPCCGVTAPTPAPAKAGNFFVAAGAWESGIAYVDADKKMQSTDCSNLIGSLVFPRIPATRGGPLPPAQVLDLGTWMGALGAEVIADGTSAAAGNVTMVSLTTGSLGAILQYGSQTVQEYISANPQTVALSELNGDMVYLNPAQIQLGDPAGLGAVALHEALHNVLGLDDAQLERALRPFGGTLGDPHSITDAISNHCL